MKRREFVNWVGIGILAGSLPAAIAACQPDTASAPDGDSGESETATDAAPREDGFAAVGTVAELDEAGFLSDADFQGAQVVVVRDPADESAVLAVDSLCTHQGCTVDWNAEANALICPCHGSQFNTDGSVAKGPADSPLSTYEAKIEADQVLVKVS